MYPTIAATSETRGVVWCRRVCATACVHLPRPSPMSHSDSKKPQDGLSLAHISRMMMEDDIVDKFSYQYPDHLKLLQAEQPFAHILTATASTSPDVEESTAPNTISSALLPNKVHDPAFVSNGTGVVESISILFPYESSINVNRMSSMAFFKGMEEAKMFLPRDNAMLDGRGRKNRFDMDGEMEAGMGRSRKQIAVHTDLEEEATTLAMLDRLILNTYDLYPSEMQEVHVTINRENKAAQKSICRRGRRGARQTMVTGLETLLTRCAEAVSNNDRRNASELLERIKQHSSPKGDARQRLAHYFAKGLEARLAGTGSHLYRSLMGTHNCTVELMKAYHLYVTTSCFVKMAVLFSNKTIYNAVAGRKKLHIVHYGIDTGSQWPKLIRWLASREGGPPEVRITNINTPRPKCRLSKKIEEPDRRLSNYASNFGVSFKFHAIAAKPEAVQAEDLQIDPDEVLVISSLFRSRLLMDETLTFGGVNPRDMVLNTIRKMKPSVFIHAVVNGSYSAAFFMTRFRQVLYYFMTLFDVIETTIPQDNDKRLLVERDIFAQCAMNIIACEGANRVERPQNYREWQARNQRAGLRQLPLDPNIVLMLKDEVKEHCHKHFMINEDHQWLLQGWKGRVLYALSTWAADNSSGSKIA